MNPRKFSLQVTSYGDGMYALAVIQQEWTKGGWRSQKPLFRSNCTQPEVEGQVLALLRQIVAEEREQAANHARRAAGTLVTGGSGTP